MTYLNLGRRLIVAGLAPAVREMPSGEFMAKDLPLPPRGSRGMRLLNSLGVVRRVGRTRTQVGVWTRGPNYHKAVRLMEEAGR